MLRSQNYFVKISKNLMTVKNYSKIISLMIFLVALVQWDLLNIGFKGMEATSLKAASQPLLLILSRFQSLKIYLSVDHNLTLNQSTQELYTVVKLLLLTLWSVVISYVKKSFFLTLRKFLTFSCFILTSKLWQFFVWISTSCWLRRMYVFIFSS